MRALRHGHGRRANELRTDRHAGRTVNVAVRNRQQETPRLMQAKDWQAAERASSRLNAQHPEFAVGWQTGSRIALVLGPGADALTRIARAWTLEPHNPHWLIHRAKCLLALGRLLEACEAAASAQHAA